MKQIWIFIFWLLSVGSVWGQQQTIHFDVRCEICDNNIDDDGDGFTDCADVDCILALPDGELRGRTGTELRKSSCPADLGLTEEQISFIKNNTAYLESMGIHGTVAAQEEAATIANCIASALVSTTLDYSIKWFELSILQDKDLDYFALGTAQDIFSNHGVSIGGNAVLACIEGINPFKLGKIEEFLINAGFGAMSGFIEGAESEYNKFKDAKCSIDDVILNKMDWGTVFSKAGTQSIITVFTVGIGARLGPIIRANSAAAAAKIKKWFGDEVWNALRDRFLKNSDELFGTYLNIKDLPDETKTILNDLSFSEETLKDLDAILATTSNKDAIEDIVNSISPNAIRNVVDNLELIDIWKSLKGLKNCPIGLRNNVAQSRSTNCDEWEDILEKILEDNDLAEIRDIARLLSDDYDIDLFIKYYKDELNRGRSSIFIKSLIYRVNYSGVVYRGDRSSLKPELVFNSGLAPKGDHDNLLLHIDGGNHGNFVSTSKKIDIANEFAGNNGYVYLIEIDNGIDVNATLGRDVDLWFPEQQEVSVPGLISPESIIGAFPKDKLSNSDFISNPNYEG